MLVCVSVCANFCVFLKNILLLRFAKVKSPIDQLQKDSLEKSYKRDIGLRPCNFYLEMVENRLAEKACFWSWPLNVNGSGSKSVTLLCIVGELAGEGCVAHAVGVSEM